MKLVKLVAAAAPALIFIHARAEERIAPHLSAGESGARRAHRRW